MSQPELLRETYPITAGDFTSAGEVSAQIKRILKKLGVPPQVLRRVAVASYEVELNLIIHSQGGRLLLEVGEQEVRICSSDMGPGIEDVGRAMQEGFSTASDDVRSLGFGAGMGLPNMKRNADAFQITSTLGVGTTIDMRFTWA